jgi:hypothetical protein
MLFDYLKNILYSKQPELLEEENDFVPFLIQRWLSMHSPEVTYILNETTNRYWMALADKQDWYNAFMTSLPRVKFRKLNYIKKAKAENSKDDDTVKLIAKNMEISEREVRLYLERIDFKVKDLDIYKK